VSRRASQNKAPHKARLSRAVNPPAITATNTVNHVFQYVSQGNLTKFSITRAFMLSTVIMNSSSSTTNYRISNAIKLNSISIWSGLPASGSAITSTVAIEWLSSYGPSKIVMDTTINVSKPAVIHSRPPVNSLAGFWSLRNSNESDVLFQVTLPTGSIIQTNVTYNLQDDTAINLVSTTNSGAVGTVYYTYLDGPAAAAVLQPSVLPFLN